MQVKLKDEWSSNIINASVSDEVVADIAGHTAKEVTFLQQKSKTQPQLKEDIARILNKINVALQNVTLIFVIAMNVKHPTGYETLVTKMLKNTDDNKQTIMLKIHDEDISTLVV